MRKIPIVFFVTIFIGLLSPQSLKSQSSSYEELLLYTPSIYNPARLVAEKKIQFDFIGYLKATEIKGNPKGFYLSTIYSPTNKNSSFGISYESRSIGYLDERLFGIGYSYNREILNDLKLFSGISLSRYNINSVAFILPENNFEDVQPLTDNVKMNYTIMGVGLGVDYKTFSLGLTGRFDLFGNEGEKFTEEELNEQFNNLILSEWFALIGNRFSIGQEFYLTPLFGYKLKKYDLNYDSRIFLGMGLNYKMIGLETSVSDSFSVIATVDILEAVKFGIMVYDVYDNLKGWNLLGHLRVKI